MRIKWTRHAEERQKEWQKKLGITRHDVEAVLTNPGQLGAGDRDAQIAQSRRGRGLLRVAFVEREEERTILTVYWTSRVEKYWTGGPDADPV